MTYGNTECLRAMNLCRHESCVEPVLAIRRFKDLQPYGANFEALNWSPDDALFRDARLASRRVNSSFYETEKCQKWS